MSHQSPATGAAPQRIGPPAPPTLASSGTIPERLELFAVRGEFVPIYQRLREPAARRAAVTDVLLRHRRVLGVGWFDLRESPPKPCLLQLPGPAVDRIPVREWLTAVASRLTTTDDTREEPSSEVRNLTALAMALPGEPRAEAVVLLAANSSPRGGHDAWRMLYDLRSAIEESQWRERCRRAEVESQLAAALVDLAGRVNSADSLKGAGQQLVRALQDHFQCGLVSVALRFDQSPNPRLLAISDGSETTDGLQSQRIEAALAECVLAKSIVRFPTAATKETAPALAHQRLTAVLGAELVVSAPLFNAEGTVFGAILLAGAAASLGHDATERFLTAAGAPIGVALQATRRHAGGPLMRCGRALAAGVTRLRMVLAAGALASVAALLTVPMPYRISAACRLEPVERRLSPAPFDGLLKTTVAAPGDIVSSGELLATLDGREIQWELAGVVADQQRALKERDAHLAAQDIAKSYLSELEAERLAARETLLRDRLTRLEVRSPIDGVVLSGSLDRRENVPVSIGQTLYEIAPVETLRLEVAVPSAEVSHVRPGLSVEVRMDGSADEVVMGTIERLRPSSETRDGHNVFVAELILDNPTGRWRPGMEGLVRITSDRHPIGWNLLHRPWDYVLSRWF
jgi:multidrug efflux pump subunit AcrA (membrane-fusion protein)